LERIEELLRDELRRDGTPLPETDTMLARVDRARRGHRLAIAGSAAVALLTAVAAAAVAGLPGRIGAGPGDALPAREYTVELVNVVFTDQVHGYAVQRRCSLDEPVAVPEGAPTPDVHRDCAAQLLVTVDSGRSWQERTLPGDPAFKDAGLDLVTGHSLMLWVDGTGALALGGWNRVYWTTTDGARTWHRSPTPRDVGPAGSLAWFGPGDTLTFLATYPPGGPDTVGGKNPVVAGADGSFWVACLSRACLHVTRDHGRTWVTQTPVPSASRVDWVSTVDGQTVYAVVRNGSGPLLVRSTDGGTTWAQVPGVTGLPDRSGDGLALPGGAVLLTRADAEGGLYRLASGSTVVEKLTAAPAHPAVLYRTGGVIVAAPAIEGGGDPDLGPVAWVSPDDGATWLPIPPPAP
jgi:hypothetical protein